MKKFVNWSNLTKNQKELAREQYLYIRECEEEGINEHDTSDSYMQSMSYEIDTEDSDYIFVNV